MEFRYQIVSTPAEFRQLQDGWEKLNILCPKGCFFTSWYWLYEWWSVYSQAEDDLFVVCAYLEQELLGVAPFYTRPAGRCSLYRELRFIGTGESEEKEVATEYLDLIFHPDYEAQVVEGMIQKVLLEANWHKSILNNVLENSVISRQLDLNTCRMTTIKESVGQRYRVSLPSCYEDYLKNIPSSNNRSKFKRSRRRFEEDFSGQIIFAESIEDVEVAMGQLISLHSLRWQSKGKAGAFLSEEFISFHGRIVKYCLAMKNLVLMNMVVAGQTIAVFYGWRYKGTLSYYQSGIDTDFRPNLSPGYVMHCALIDDSIQSGSDYYDFMKGGEKSYKSKFGCETEPMIKVILFNKNIKGKMLYRVERVINIAKRAKVAVSQLMRRI